MPVITVNISQTTYSDIMALVGNGVYAGLEQFLLVSAFNQLALERGTPVEDLAKSRTTSGDVGRFTGQRTLAVRELGRRSARRAQHLTIAKQRRCPVSITQEVAAAMGRFSIEGLRQLALSPCGTTVGNGNQRIWGQVNRVFPLKLATRWIAAAGRQRGSWPELSGIIEQLASDAAMIGSALEQADSERGRKREEMLAIGLPRAGNLQSHDRYLSQFIARIIRSGHIYPGAITHYGLASFDHDRLVLSERGMALALLKNPVLDQSPFSCSTTLSEEEKKFFVAHISERIPIERNDFATILRAVENGNTTPESLLNAVRNTCPAEWSDLAFRTHVYGVLGRLGELGLVGKDWEGRRVQYKVLDAASGLLDASGSDEKTG